MENQVHQYQTPCSYSQHICFDQIFFKKCRWQHSHQNFRQMKIKWGNMKHGQRRELQMSLKQTKRQCKSGINCYYLLKGDCGNGHCCFDHKLAFNIRRRLFQIQCPLFKCKGNSCVYRHPDTNNQFYELSLKKIKKLYKKQKALQGTLLGSVQNSHE